MPKKVKTKHVQPIQRHTYDPDPVLQFNVRKDIDDDRRVKEKDVFEGKSTTRRKQTVKKGPKKSK
tara:strand:+ start:364 stop:558 length:195 start_codon:yes stop_codon:yes gene_type:complete